MSIIIGVTPDLNQKKYVVQEEYISAIQDAGGFPMILPLIKTPTDASKIIESIDGLLLSGGDDVDPHYYGEEPLPGLGKLCPERDESEISIVKEALTREIPILAICRGMHVLNVAAGGTLYQDILTQTSAPLLHYQSAPRDAVFHSVQVIKDSILYQSLGSETCRVNSFHHQAVKAPAPNFKIVASAPDGIIEGIESARHPFVVGVQWHPGSLTKKEAHARGLFHAFIKAADTYASKTK